LLQESVFYEKRCTFFATIFMFGLFNNNGYSMVMAGADSLAKTFDMEKLLPLF
jgi:hypothetical protein